ncbi:hypothetical protein IU483_24835 [Streptomyces gardneri]|nr:hypothetical protein [Streptomyces gardneri]
MTMTKNGLVMLVQVGGAVEEVTVIVVPEERADAMTVPVHKPRRGWRLSALSIARMLFRALNGAAALALMHGAQRIRWAEVLNWLTS